MYGSRNTTYLTTRAELNLWRSYISCKTEVSWSAVVVFFFPLGKNSGAKRFLACVVGAWKYYAGKNGSATETREGKRFKDGTAMLHLLLCAILCLVPALKSAGVEDCSYTTARTSHLS